jgi:hypothetical protein
VSRRVQLVLPDPVAMQLDELAAGAQEPPATVAAQMLRGAVAQAATDGAVRPLRPVPERSRARSARARWLEPYGGDPTWSRQMWGAVVALHGRYPRQLEAVKDGWWCDEAQTEMLCAMATWRTDIDDGGEDPREEMAFHAQLSTYTQLLRQQGGGVAKAWQPGAPPAGWS